MGQMIDVNCVGSDKGKNSSKDCDGVCLFDCVCRCSSPHLNGGNGNNRAGTKRYACNGFTKGASFVEILLLTPLIASAYFFPESR